MSIAFCLWVWEPFQLSSHCILCWIPRYSGNDPLWHGPCCYGSVDSDTLPIPNRTQHIFNEIALGGRSVVNLWSAVFSGWQIFCSPPANKEERFVWKCVQDTPVSLSVHVCRKDGSQVRSLYNFILVGEQKETFGDCWCVSDRVSDLSQTARVCQDTNV